MTKPTSMKLVALVLATVAFGACGEDPYSGDSHPADASADTPAGTGTTTVTTTVTGTNSGTQTTTGSSTSTATSSQTWPSTDTRTSTGSSTSPTTMTTTAVITVTLTGTGTAVDAGAGDPGHQDLYVSVATARPLDLVFMIDNSPSMAPKVSKLSSQLPKLIGALKDPADGTLPDLRVAIIDSDLGSGGAYPSGMCGTKPLPDGTTSQFGDLGRFQMLKTPTSCTFNDGAQFLEYRAGQPVNYTGDINQVVACLAGNLGTMGCGVEHQLQAFEFALVARGIGNENQQTAFLRPAAQLGLVFLSDEDDCSAAPNGRLFGDIAEARGESASLRCATRAHKCGGQNLTDVGPKYPTSAAYTHAFSDCAARVGDECSPDTDTSKPTSCNPLKSVKTFADEIKALKVDPDNQVFVAGIFGWPLGDADMATAQYKVAPVPNPNTADIQHPTVYDYWPICYDPDHLPNHPDTVTGFDAEAAGWGATGGLRASAFVDQFGANGLKLSICERDYSASMKKIGDSVAKKLQNLCVDSKLLDSDLGEPGVQAECSVYWRLPQPDPSDPSRVIYSESTTPMPRCPANSSNGAVAEDCWQLTSDNAKCPVNGQLVNVLRTAAEIASVPQLSPGTKIHMNCHVCASGLTEPGCNY